MIKRIFSIALIAAFSIGVVLAQKNNKVKKYLLPIGGHNQTAEYGSLIDLKKGKTYKVAEVVNNQGDIDLLYAYGQTTKANLLTPGSTALTQFGPNYRDKIDGAWDVKNRGLMVVIKADKGNKKIHKGLKKNQDIEKLYAETAKSVKTLEGYQLTKYGPSRRLTNIQEGDLILFRSQDRKFYAAGFVSYIEEGVKGSIEIDFKITE